jgi:endonuclease/exonuclease/phosphatase family metal-dependent hydrolase
VEGQKGDLKVMSFNVRTAHAKDGANAWGKRKDLFFKTIGDYGPDLIGFQEVVEEQYDAITGEMKDYTPVGVARDDGKRKGEWSLIMFKTGRFVEEGSGTFWLSETPEVAGSKSWDAALTRVCSYVKLKDKETGREFLYANTHFDHKGPVARLHSAELIRKKLPELAGGLPILMTGDFNTNETNPPYGVLTKDHWLVDTYREVHPEVKEDESSFSAFVGKMQGKRIDFILHTKEFVGVEAEIDRAHSEDNRYPSDHYAVTGRLRFEEKK